LRVVTLSDDAVLNALKKNFVCGFKNITGQPYAGKSGQHDPDSPAVFTTNGAGPHNVQIFFLSSDGVVLHCLPGYWSPVDFLHEMQFALTMNQLWTNASPSLDKKKELFRQAQLADMRSHPMAMRQRSRLQKFDENKEKQKSNSDFAFKPGDFHPIVILAAGNRHKAPKIDDMKCVDQVVHERMAQRPFVPYEEFDVERFSDYGKMRYDKHEKDDSHGMRAVKRK
jgi:hypothetical protein